MTAKAEAERVAEEPFVGMIVVIESISQRDRDHMNRITYHDSVLGLLLHTIHSDQRRSLRMSHDVIGLLVYRVDPQSLAQRAGILSGDVLISVDRKRVGGGTCGFKRFTPYFKAVFSVELEILRKGHPLTLRVEIDKQSAKQ